MHLKRAQNIWKNRVARNTFFLATTFLIRHMPENIDIEEWTIKPMRRKNKAGVDEVCGFHHRDYVTYTYRNGETHTGYVTAMYPELHALNFQSPTKHCKKANALKCKLVWRYSKIYWFKCA